MKADHHGAVRELPHSFRVHPRHMKAIPSTGERIPVIGLGTASSFSRAARTPEENVMRDDAHCCTSKLISRTDLTHA